MLMANLCKVWFAMQITTEAELTSKAVYLSDWSSFQIKEQIALVNIIQKSDDIKPFKAGAVYDITLENYIEV